MHSKLSRRRIAAYCAERLLTGDKTVMRELAALLVVERREREVSLIVRDIERELLRRGVAVADVTSAHALADTTVAELKRFIMRETGSETVVLRTDEQPELLAGVRVRLPDTELDTTARTRLTRLKTMKV